GGHSVLLRKHASRHGFFLAAIPSYALSNDSRPRAQEEPLPHLWKPALHVLDERIESRRLQLARPGRPVQGLHIDAEDSGWTVGLPVENPRVPGYLRDAGSGIQRTSINAYGRRV